MEVQANRKEFDCVNCIYGRHCDESNPAAYPQWVIPGVIESRTCLLPMVTSFSKEMLRIYPHWDRGVMPFPGSLYEQPNIVLQAMEIIAGARANVKRKP